MWYCETCGKWHFSAIQVKTPDGRGTCLRKWQKECPHANTYSVSVGGYHYSAGEVWDDLREEVFCADCGKKLSKKELSQRSPAFDETEEAIF